MVSTLSNQGRQRIEKLVREILVGEHRKERLPNSSYDFSKERQAMYFSNMRKNLQSDVSNITMNINHRLEELEMLNKIRE